MEKNGDIIIPELDKKVFSSNFENTIFQDWLKTNSFIEAQKTISRSDWEKLNGNFLTPTGLSDKGAQKYIMQLPEDLKQGELAGIIYRINKTVYGENIPSYASSKNVLNSLKIAIYELLQFKKRFGGNDKNGSAIEKAIKKYIALYEQSGGKDVQIFSSETFNPYNQSKNIKVSKKSGDLEQITSGEEAENMMDKWISSGLQDSFDRSIFEEGKMNLLNHMSTFTKKDFENTEKMDPNIRFNFLPTFTDIDKKLKDVIGADTFKTDIENLKRKYEQSSGQEKEKILSEIVEKEKEVSGKILSIIFNNFPRNNSEKANKNAGNSSPSHILETKEMVCVGKAILAHTFLEYIGIKHFGANLPGHSALVTELSNGEKYFFDPTNISIPKKINLDEKRKEGAFYIVPGLYHSNESYNKLSIGESEEVLMGHVNHNKGVSLAKEGKTEEALEYINKAEKQNPSNVDFLFFKISLLRKVGNYTEALKTLLQIKNSGADTRYIYENLNLANLNFKGFIPKSIDADAMHIYKNSRDGFEKEYIMGGITGENSYFEKAMSYPNKKIDGEINTLFIEFLYQKGKELNKKGDYTGVIELLLPFSKNTLDLDGVIAVAYFNLGKYEIALQYINKLLSIYPEGNEWLYKLKGKTIEKMGK